MKQRFTLVGTQPDGGRSFRDELTGEYGPCLYTPAEIANWQSLQEKKRMVGPWVAIRDTDGVFRPVCVEFDSAVIGGSSVVMLPDGNRWIQKAGSSCVMYSLNGSFFVDGQLLGDNDPRILELRRTVDGATGESKLVVQTAEAPDSSECLIKVDTTSPTDFRVDARELHARLEVGKDFSTWIKDRIASAGFVEGEDFEVCSPISGSKECGEIQKGRGGHNTKEYRLTLDMAKELSMLERSDTGRRIRRYFIACEKELRSRPPVTRELDFSDPLTAARLYIEAEEGRRLALREVEAKTLEVAAATARVEAKEVQLDLLTARLEAPDKCRTLTEFAKDTESVLGMTPPVLFQYLRDAGILNKREAVNRDRSNVVLSPWSGKGLFTMVKHPVIRSVRADGEVKDHEVVNMMTPKLTPDTVDAAGNVTKIGGWTWLFRKIQSDPRATLCRLVARDGGREGRWAPLYGCRLVRAAVDEGLKVRDHSVIMWRKSDAGNMVEVCRFMGDGWWGEPAPTLERALERLLASTPANAPKVLVKGGLFDE